MKIVFLDTEFTSIHAYTTLISIGMVTLEGQEFYVTLNDYNRDQITPWVKENVLDKIDESKSVSSKEALLKLENFLESYAAGDKICLISPGKCSDLSLVFELWHEKFPEKKYFYTLECLPSYLNHRTHLDLDTLFLAAGIDPEISRESFAEVSSKDKHNALYDAKVVRLCFLKMISNGMLPQVKAWIEL